jgi:hypothetical protein
MINKVKLVIGVLLCLGNPLSVQAIPCDANLDGVVDRTDIEFILRDRGTPATAGQGAQNEDINGNGIVDILDARQCAAQQCQAPACDRAPIASASSDQTAPLVGTTVVLDGSGSTDPDGDRLTYQWELTQVPSGSQASLSDKTAVRPTFIVDTSGNYQVTLVVNDGDQNSLQPAQVNISAVSPPPIPIPPVANAGPDQFVELFFDVAGALVTVPVTLNGSGSSDANGDTLTYRWSLTPPAGSNAVLSDPAAPNPTFVVDASGTYVAQLIVNDGTEDSILPDTVTITGDIRPVANAGPDQPDLIGQTFLSCDTIVQLSGQNSSDTDGFPGPLTYQWTFVSIPPGSSATFSNPNIVNPTFLTDIAGTYEIGLIVSDGLLDSPLDGVNITCDSIIE